MARWLTVIFKNFHFFRVFLAIFAGYRLTLFFGCGIKVPVRRKAGRIRKVGNGKNGF
jgi:hypothetical protein